MATCIPRVRTETIQVVSAPDGYDLHLTDEEAAHILSVLGRVRRNDLRAPETKEANSHIYNCLAAAGVHNSWSGLTLVNRG